MEESKTIVSPSSKEQVQKKLPSLIKESKLYDLVIPSKVQQKIDYLCNKIHHVEWSGTLFYTIRGSFDSEEEPLTVIIVDIFPQDIGSAAYTEFRNSPALANYMVENMELLEDDIFMGLIHSHNNMSTFFSGTDTGTLQQEGAEQNHFVSLIVNNAKRYTAGITRKVITKQDISEEYSYKSFFDRLVNAKRKRTVEIESIEWFNLNVLIEDDFNLDEMDARLKEIEDSKKVTTSFKPTNGNSVGFKSNLQSKDWDWEYPKNSYKGDTQLTFDDLKDDKIAFEVEDTEQLDINIPYGKVHFDEKEVEQITRQIVTGSILLTAETTFDLNKFVNTSNRLFERRFSNVNEFAAWAENHIDYLITTAYDEKLVKKYGDDAAMAVCAFDVKERLKKLPSSVYIDELIDIVSVYIL